MESFNKWFLAFVAPKFEEENEEQAKDNVPKKVRRRKQKYINRKKKARENKK